MKSDSAKENGSGLALGMGFGVAMGAALGVALDNLAVGMGCGVAMGPAMGLLFTRAKGRGCSEKPKGVDPEL